MRYDTWRATKSHNTPKALQSIIRCSVTPILDVTGIWGYCGNLGASCLVAIEFAPRVRTSKKAKKMSRGGNDQSGSQAPIRSVPQRMTGSALPSRANRTTIRGSERIAPLIKALERGEETERGAPAVSCAAATATRSGARKGTATSNLAESSLQLVAPSVMVARPRSMASLSTIRTWKNSLAVSAKPTLRRVDQVTRTRRGVSGRLRTASLATISEIEAVATQIGQLMPGHAEKRIAAPRAEVRRAADQATAEAEGRMRWFIERCRVLYTTK